MEPIELMEMFGFNQTWCDHIVALLMSNPSTTFSKPEWKTAITSFPNTLSQIQYWYIKRNLGYG